MEKRKSIFDTFSKSSRNIIAYELTSAKKAGIRKKRFDKFLAMLEGNVRPK